MALAAAWAALIAVSPVQLPAQEREVRFGWDNDAFAFPNNWAESDFGYTNGIHLSSDIEKLPWLARFFTDGLLPCTRVRRSRLACARSTVSFGQEIYTPKNKEASTLLVEDRPYAGLLYVGSSTRTVSPVDARSVELKLGVTGGPSLAAAIHNAAHRVKLLNSTPARGWRNQLETEPVVAVSVRRDRMVAEGWRGALRVGDLVAHVGSTIGTLETSASAGVTARAGHNVPHAWLPRASGWRHAGLRSAEVYVLAAIGGRIVARNLFLDGNTFGRTHAVEKRPIVGSYAFGFGIRQSRVALTYRLTTTTQEYVLGPRLARYGAFTVSYFQDLELTDSSGPTELAQGGTASAGRVQR